MGRRHGLFGLLVVLTGCRQLFGLTEPTAITSDGHDDSSELSDALSVTDAAPGCFGRTSEDVVCFAVQPTGNVTLPSSIDTDQSSLCQQTTSGPRGCVIAGSTIQVTTTVVVSGSRPLVLVASGSINIVSTATLDVASHTSKQGPGANAVECGIPMAAFAGGGGAGGSFGGRGGDGGRDHNSVGAGTAALPFIPTAIHGGCRGGNGSTPMGLGGAGGGGGGAILLIATSLTIDGAINASGAGGSGAPGGADTHGAGGGGAGGMIAIDAAAINGGGRLVANGGGGGGGGAFVAAGVNGADPNPATLQTPALGGAGCCQSADGGAGGAGATHAGVSVVSTAQNGSGGGGGGGGTGVIRFYDATFTTGMISPR